MDASYRVNRLLQKPAMTGMTFPEMLCFIAIVVCVVIGGKLCNQIVGSWYGYLLGGIFGVVAGIAGIFGFGFLLHSWKKFKSKK